MINPFSHLTNRPIFQFGIVVPDIDAAIQGWLSTGRTGPFYLRRHFNDMPITYRGEKSTLDISLAMAQAGELQIELIQPHAPEKNVYSEVFAPGQGGVHHIGIVVSDFVASHQAYLDSGIVCAEEGVFGSGTRFSYLDTIPQIGLMTEVVEATDELNGVLQMVADSAVDWNGENPIRSL